MLNDILHRVQNGERFTICGDEIPVRGILIRQSGELAVLLKQHQQRLHPVVVYNGEMSVALFPHGSVFLTENENTTLAESIREYNTCISEAVKSCRSGDYALDHRIVGYILFDKVRATEPITPQLATEVSYECLRGGYGLPISTRAYIFGDANPRVASVEQLDGFNVGLVDSARAIELSHVINAATRAAIGLIAENGEPAEIDGIAVLNNGYLAAIRRGAVNQLTEVRVYLDFVVVTDRPVGGTMFNVDEDLHGSCARYNRVLDEAMQKSHVDRHGMKIAMYVTW